MFVHVCVYESVLSKEGFWENVCVCVYMCVCVFDRDLFDNADLISLLLH